MHKNKSGLTIGAMRHQYATREGMVRSDQTDKKNRYIINHTVITVSTFQGSDRKLKHIDVLIDHRHLSF